MGRMVKSQFFCKKIPIVFMVKSPISGTCNGPASPQKALITSIATLVAVFLAGRYPTMTFLNAHLLQGADNFGYFRG